MLEAAIRCDKHIEASRGSEKHLRILETMPSEIEQGRDRVTTDLGGDARIDACV